MAVVNAADANRGFSRLLRQVAAGERVTILSRGRPVATIAPADQTVASYGPCRRALLERLNGQPAQPLLHDWHRDDLYD